MNDFNSKIIFRKTKEEGHANIDRADMIKPFDIDKIILSLIKAKETALENAIIANTVLINDKFAKVKNFSICLDNTVYAVPPMIAGLYIKFVDLPKQFAFALAQLPEPDGAKLLAEAREESRRVTLGEVVEWLLNEAGQPGEEIFQMFIKHFGLDEVAEKDD